MAGSLGCARGTWEPWMTRHWDLLPVTARNFVCAGSVTAASGNLHISLQRGLLFVAPHSTGKGYRRGLATLVRGSLHEEFFLFPNFPPAVRISCTTADTEGCGVSMESTIFTETFSTAACAYAPTRRTVEAREQMSTVLDHLVTHIVDVPFCLARSAEERAHGCSLSLATAAYPGTKLVMHKPRRRPTSHSSLTHGPPALFSLAERTIRARQLKPEAYRSTAAGDWEPTRTDATLTRGEGGCTGPPPQRGFAQIRMAATATATHHPEHIPLVRPGCRTADTQRNMHGNASSSRWTPPRHDPTPGRLSGVRQTLQLPH
ncbi:hypothetical protein TcCL_Unassigned00049 [Trypanosoma cruzi]|nr:hypothetical protein TcCL_Unassigned00049 [Trypanosoma cruzi]